MIAALFVETNGVYFGLPNVDPWDEQRDARLYDGSWPVVAHPPCARWGRYWHGGPSAKVRMIRGDDGGCFASALASVRRFGGVLEHPEASSAWRQFDLNTPPWGGAWVAADFVGGWTCCVEQGHYGHRARKPTWLYASGIRALPSLEWGKADGVRCIDAGYHSAEERSAARVAGTLRGAGRMSKRERAATPPAFRDMLIALAQSVNPRATLPPNR